jgi:outer membrane protein TolC
MHLRDEIVAMLEKRLEVGEAARPDVVRVRGDARAARLALRDEEGRAAEREAVLAASIGIARAALPPLDLTPLETAAPPPRPDPRELALTKRADIVAALARYAAEEQALRLEVRRQYPDLHVGPGIGWDQGAFRWALNASAEIPLFNRHRGAIAEAEARRDAAGARLLALQSKILGDLDQAVASERASRARLDETERVVASRRALEEQTARQFAAGEIDRLAMRQQELETALAELDRWNAWFDVQRAIVAVDAAVGVER